MVELQHRFTVPAGVEETWSHFNDIEGVAGCFPGAVVTEADAESFTGTVKVKLGPIALVYNGTGTFVEKDEAARRMVIDARGKDKRGNGTAGAMVTATMTEAGPGETAVEVLTDLNITGKAAQFGRGNVMKDVSDKLLGQFVACLEQRLGSAGDVADDGAAATPAPPEEKSAPTAPPGDPTRAEGTPPAAPQPAAAPPPPPPRPAPARDDEALDLGAAVLPVLARAYWKPALGVLAVVALVVWWLAGRD
jgi:carbon monoxide dehydrogenase subunit G